MPSGLGGIKFKSVSLFAPHSKIFFQVFKNKLNFSSLRFTKLLQRWYREFSCKTHHGDGTFVTTNEQILIL